MQRKLIQIKPNYAISYTDLILRQYIILLLKTNLLKKQSRVFLILIGFFISFYTYFSIKVPKAIASDDYKIKKLLNVDKECSNLNTYKKEIICIENLQKAQLNLIKGTECRGKYINLGSIEVINENSACCYDRSRITEQTLQIYGFKVRHIHLSETKKKGYFNLLVPRSKSHAATEVLTSKGWLGVDSNEQFLLLDKDNFPITYEKAIASGEIKFYSEFELYKKPLTYVIGLYSRNGTFFEPYLPYLPEINFKDFFSNLLNIKIVNPITNNGLSFKYVKKSLVYLL